MTTGAPVRPRENYSNEQGLGALVFKTTTERFLSLYIPAVAGGLVKPRHKLPSLFAVFDISYTVFWDCSAT